MVRQFDIPVFYKSEITSQVKKSRQISDPRKRDLSPTVLDFGPVRFILARHFGFCFGVENAIEIAYKTLEDHSDRRVFFLSEMIHNPNVNRDLQSRGVQFIFTTAGDQLIPWNTLDADDVVVVPAFGTTIEIEQELESRGIDPYTYNTTCPFVEKVWKRSTLLGESGCTVVVHGKAWHEETRATFSHSVAYAPTMILMDIHEARILAKIILGEAQPEAFNNFFAHKCSDGFDPVKDLEKLGVVNQTTMLATETRAITKVLRQALIDRYGEDQIHNHFADTSDTLCYATTENQNATYALVEKGAHLALVVGGYNSSNTSHLVELCLKAMPTYFIKNATEIKSELTIRQFDLDTKQVNTTEYWLPENRPLDIVLTCGASCPDAVVDEVLLRVLSFFPDVRLIEEVLGEYVV